MRMAATLAFFRAFSSPLGHMWQKSQSAPTEQPLGFQYQAQGLHLPTVCIADPMEGVGTSPGPGHPSTAGAMAPSGPGAAVASPVCQVAAAAGAALTKAGALPSPPWTPGMAAGAGGAMTIMVGWPCITVGCPCIMVGWPCIIVCWPCIGIGNMTCVCPGIGTGIAMKTIGCTSGAGCAAVVGTAGAADTAGIVGGAAAASAMAGAVAAGADPGAVVECAGAACGKTALPKERVVGGDASAAFSAGAGVQAAAGAVCATRWLEPTAGCTGQRALPVGLGVGGHSASGVATGVHSAQRRLLSGDIRKLPVGLPPALTGEMRQLPKFAEPVLLVAAVPATVRMLAVGVM